MAEQFTKATVFPKDLEVGGHLWDSPLQNSEKESIARNIILLSQWNDNRWLEFTWQGYQDRCKHKATEGEKRILDEFVRMGLLAFEGDVYLVRDQFVDLFKQFIKKQ